MKHSIIHNLKVNPILKRMLYSTIIIGLLVYGFLFFMLLTVTNKLLFPQPPSSYVDSEKISKIQVDDMTIAYQYFEVKNPKHFILYSHGNGEDIAINESRMELISAKYQANVLIWDYPGYGISTGKPTEKTVNKSILALKELINSKGFTDDQIILWGHSVGGGPSVFLAEQYDFKAVILVCTFLSASRVMTKIPIFPFDYFNSAKAIQKNTAPTLFIHGRKDKVVPFSHGEKLYELTAGPREKLWIDQAGHNDLTYDGGTLYWGAIDNFVAGLEEN